MNMSQDAYNKLVTLVLLTYTLVMATLSWVYNKPFDLSTELTILTPILAHSIHLVSNKVPDKAGSNGTPH